jgi:hypothetical protein
MEAEARLHEADPPADRARVHIGSPDCPPSRSPRDRAGLREQDNPATRPVRLCWNGRIAAPRKSFPSRGPRPARLAEALSELAGVPDGLSLTGLPREGGDIRALEPSAGKAAPGSDRAVFLSLRGNGLVVV